MMHTIKKEFALFIYQLDSMLYSWNMVPLLWENEMTVRQCLEKLADQKEKHLE